MNIGIVGGAGYTGGELLRILVGHPDIKVKFVHSNSNAGNKVYQVHQDLMGYTDLVFTNQLSTDIDALVLCLGHGHAKKFLDTNPSFYNVKIVDLSTDFRHAREGNNFIYGLPELNKEKIKSANHIANPGCFATCIQLGILPLAAAQKIQDELHITAVTGSTGAGQSPSATSHFSWRANNMSIYKPFDHQHLQEIGESLEKLQSGNKDINFVPFRGDFTRGIIASIYTNSDLSEDQAIQLYKDYYKDAPFTYVVDENPNLKQVVNTNNCFVYVKKYGKKLHIISIVDNLTKGASGQAVQNLNLMFGLDERAGLNLKPVGF